MKDADARERGESARENEIAGLKDRALGLRIALAGMRPLKYQSAKELKIRARKAAQLRKIEARLSALQQGSLFERNGPLEQKRQ